MVVLCVVPKRPAPLRNHSPEYNILASLSDTQNGQGGAFEAVVEEVVLLLPEFEPLEFELFELPLEPLFWLLPELFWEESSTLRCAISGEDGDRGEEDRGVFKYKTGNGR